MTRDELERDLALAGQIPLYLLDEEITLDQQLAFNRICDYLQAQLDRLPNQGERQVLMREAEVYKDVPRQGPPSRCSRRGCPNRAVVVRDLARGREWLCQKHLEARLAAR